MPAVTYELTPKFDSSQNFYHKATVTTIDTGLVLRSYETPVVVIDNETNEVTLLPRWDDSATTLRHVKEFLRQNGFKAETKAQMTKDYFHG